MSDLRPKNLNLFTISFPIPAIVSILHRISGLFLFLLIPIALWALSISLTESGFNQLTEWAHLCSIKFIFWLVLIPFCFHLVAGVRHLLSDIHVGDTLKMGRLTAVWTFIITIILVILVGVWLW